MSSFVCIFFLRMSYFLFSPADPLNEDEGQLKNSVQIISGFSLSGTIPPKNLCSRINFFRLFIYILKDTSKWQIAERFG